MTSTQYTALARQLARLSGTTRCEKDLLATILAGRLTQGDRKCLEAMRDRHLSPRPNQPTLKIEHRRLNHA